MRELLSRGITPVCLVRSPHKLLRQHPQVASERLSAVAGNLNDRRALREAASGCQAVIHLVGIIMERRLKRQTFHGIHVRGTRNVIDATQQAGIKRYVHMSALGTRVDAISKYHRTKWAAEELVRGSGLDWTIFRPSLIHGPEGEFMQLMKKFMCGLVPPIIPYFGTGDAKLQPVHVKDVAFCLVEALERPNTAGHVYSLGGPRSYSWREFYNACRTLMPCEKSWKPMISYPVPLAKLIAALSAPPMALAELVMPSMGLLRFDRGQVQMSQEDSVCDHTIAEKVFGVRMRDFEQELATYADQIE